MRRFLAIVLVLAVTALGAPVSLLAADSNSVNLTGTAYTVNLQPLPNAAVQIRNFQTGNRVSSTISDRAGEFSFSGLAPGTYIIEIVDVSGRVIGMTAPFRLGSERNTNVSVVAVAHGLVTPGQNGGFSLLGLGPVTSLAVLGAAGAAAVTAVVATRPDASPSR
jgi:hypothetical protein